MPLYDFRPRFPPQPEHTYSTVELHFCEITGYVLQQSVNALISLTPSPKSSQRRSKRLGHCCAGRCVIKQNILTRCPSLLSGLCPDPYLQHQPQQVNISKQRQTYHQTPLGSPFIPPQRTNRLSSRLRSLLPQYLQSLKLLISFRLESIEEAINCRPRAGYDGWSCAGSGKAEETSFHCVKFGVGVVSPEEGSCGEGGSRAQSAAGDVHAVRVCSANLPLLGDARGMLEGCCWCDDRVT